MVSGFLISPNDQERIRSGEAMPILIMSNVSGLATGLAKLVSSFISIQSLSGEILCSGGWGRGCLAAPASLSRGQRHSVVVQIGAVQFPVEAEAGRFLDRAGR